MFYVDHELIQETLKNCSVISSFYYKKLSKKFLNWLFHHYEIEEVCEDFYDTCPKMDDNLYIPYFLYEYGSNSIYSDKEYRMEEMTSAHKAVHTIYEEYELNRIKYCKWQEPYFKGNWGMSQYDVEQVAIGILKEIRVFPRIIKERLYVGQENDYIVIYFYGRDYLQRDYWLTFKKRKKRLK